MAVDVSVIITALDEPYVNKTIDGIIENSDSSLKEIIVIDDVSKEPIQHKEANVIRNKERMGLIRGRNLATEMAKSEVIISIDPHCKVSDAWIKPLRNAVSDDKKTIVIPTTYSLDVDRWEIIKHLIGHNTHWGWNLEFFWAPWKIESFSPAVAGHCFCFSKDWWEEIGRFDSGMNIWGGENIEFSLRTWLCGGTVRFVEDSWVGHWFKEKFQYKMDTATLLANKSRIAEVWFGEYKQVFYDSVSINRGMIDFGDLRERIQIRNKKQERSFDWFIGTIQPELTENHLYQELVFKRCGFSSLPPPKREAIK